MPKARENITADLSGGVLELNGGVLNASQIDAIQTVLRLAAGEISDKAFASWLKEKSA
jgi:prophage maintenance system killer protein